MIIAQKNITQNKIYSCLEICAGGGGAAIGIEKAGFSPVALIDNNQQACNTLRLNRPNWNVIDSDIRYFDATPWKGIDLLSGGLPCPPFSIAGKQLGEEDERNMFPVMLELVEKLYPRAVMIENVKGILSSRFTRFREDILFSLDNLGYIPQWKLLNAADFGVPQTRSRAFLVAIQKDESKTFTWPTPNVERKTTIDETIGDLMAEKGWQGLNEWIDKAHSVAPTIVGGSHKHGGPDLGPTRARKEWAKMGIDGLGLANEPPKKDFSGMPRLTLQMVARIQGFPDEWKFAGSKTQAYRQVGNALPVQLAYVVAREIYKCLE
jgi:DNA (cytosine-5)-methyltransferase 1